VDRHPEIQPQAMFHDLAAVEVEVEVKVEEDTVMIEPADTTQLAWKVVRQRLPVPVEMGE
jgi:virulence-associated protein VagC